MTLRHGPLTFSGESVAEESGGAPLSCIVAGAWASRLGAFVVRSRIDPSDNLARPPSERVLPEMERAKDPDSLLANAGVLPIWLPRNSANARLTGRRLQFFSQ